MFGKTTGKNAAKKVEFTGTGEFEGIPVEVVHRRVKYSRVEFKSDGLRVVVPRHVNPLDLLRDNRDYILGKYQRLVQQTETARQIPMTDWGDVRFKAVVGQYMEYYSDRLRVTCTGLKFRKMKRRWGSCRSDGRITLNSFLQFVPEHLIAYVVYHELSHLRFRGHGRNFKALIASEFPHYRQLDKELNLYGLKLLS